MANVRTRGTDKVKVVSAVITLAVIVALVFGIFSVAQNVKKSKNNNLVNLNETEGNVAIKTDDDPDIPVEDQLLVMMILLMPTQEQACLMMVMELRMRLWSRQRSRRQRNRRSSL